MSGPLKKHEWIKITSRNKINRGADNGSNSLIKFNNVSVTISAFKNRKRYSSLCEKWRLWYLYQPEVKTNFRAPTHFPVKEFMTPETSACCWVPSTFIKVHLCSWYARRGILLHNVEGWPHGILLVYYWYKSHDNVIDRTFFFSEFNVNNIKELLESVVQTPLITDRQIPSLQSWYQSINGKYFFLIVIMSRKTRP